MVPRSQQQAQRHAAFFRGLGSVLTIMPCRRRFYFYFDRAIYHQSASDALRSDWTKIGNDLYASLRVAVEAPVEETATSNHVYR